MVRCFTLIYYAKYFIFKCFKKIDKTISPAPNQLNVLSFKITSKICAKLLFFTLDIPLLLWASIWPTWRTASWPRERPSLTSTTPRPPPWPTPARGRPSSTSTTSTATCSSSLTNSGRRITSSTLYFVIYSKMPLLTPYFTQMSHNNYWTTFQSVFILHFYSLFQLFTHYFQKWLLE